MPNGRRNDWSKTSVSVVASLRPHQIARKLRAIQRVSIRKSSAPPGRLWAIWPKRAHWTGVITIPNVPQLISDLFGRGSIVLPWLRLPWPPQVHNNKMYLRNFEQDLLNRPLPRWVRARARREGFKIDWFTARARGPILI